VEELVLIKVDDYFAVLLMDGKLNRRRGMRWWDGEYGRIDGRKDEKQYGLSKLLQDTACWISEREIWL
jgi:hypothetical protein